MIHSYILIQACFVLLLTIKAVGCKNLLYQQDKSPALLIWAVKLDMLAVARDHCQLAADTIAADVGLHNLGQIGGLRGYYAMSYSALGAATYDSMHANHDVHKFYHMHHNVTNSEFYQNNVTVEAFLQDIVLRINKKLDWHSFVEWHSQQRNLFRYRRAAESDDNQSPLAFGVRRR